jgi:hypothetical protein
MAVASWPTNVDPMQTSSCCHLRSTTPSLLPDDECPSAADFPICCPGVRAGPTAQYMAIRGGLDLVVVPRALISVWVEE